MKKLLFSLVLVLAGCHQRQPGNAVLLEAEQEVDRHPQRTIEMIYKLESDSLEETDRALYGLLMNEAIHKVGVVMKSDSVLEQGRQFFERSGDRDRLIRATLHKGISLYDDRQYAEAVGCVKRAEQLLKPSDRPALRYDVFQMLGRMNEESSNNDLAIRYFQQALAAARQAENVNGEAMALTHLAAIWGKEGDVKRQNSFIKQTEPLLRRVDKHVRAVVLTSLAAMNLRVGYELTAQQQLQEAYELEPQELTVKLMGDLCSKYGRHGEAVDYWYMALNGFDLDLQTDAYQKLIDHFTKQENYERALDLSSRLNKVLQLKSERGKADGVVEMQNTFESHASSSRALMRIIILLSVLLLLFVGILLLVVYHRWRVRRLSGVIERLNARYAADLSSYGQMSAELKQMQQERLTDGEVMAAKQRQIEELEQRLADYQEDKQRPAAWNVGNELLHAEGVARLHALAAKGQQALPDDWYTLSSLMGEFLAKLNPHELNAKEMHLCMLIKLRFIPSEMAILTNSSPQTVTNMRVRLLEKIFGEKGGARDLDRRIREL